MSEPHVIWVGRDNEVVLQLRVGTAVEAGAAIGIDRVVVELGGPDGLVIDSDDGDLPANAFNLFVADAEELVLRFGLVDGIADWEGTQDATLTVYATAWPNGLIWTRDLAFRVEQP